MSLVPSIAAYFATAIFAVAVIARFVMWAKMPMHLRWELYPVAHEAKRAQYGGSYLEESEWWTKPRETSLMGELKVMIPEILFLVALKEHNPKLWIRSFPFHFGLYLTIGCIVLMALTGLLGAVAPDVLTGGFAQVLLYTITILGVGGLALGLLGALGLLQRRISDPDLRDSTAGADLFNLIFFVVVACLGLLAFVLVEDAAAKATAFVGGLVTFSPIPIHGPLPVISVLLACVLVAYIPLTHMSHFVGKYFAYHAIRWNDKPNLRGSDEEAMIGAMLQQPVTWAAPHINADGKKNWVDLAMELPKEEPKK